MSTSPRIMTFATVLLLAGLSASAAPIHDAAGAGDQPRVAAILAADRAAADLPGDDQFKSRPLHLAAGKGYLEVVRMLLDAGAAVDGFDSDQSRPLDVAAQGGHPKVVALLLERGADVNRRDRNGNCPMSFAAGRGRVEVVRQLLAAGADANYVSRAGVTLLHQACSADSPELVKVLIEQGVDVNAQTTYGDTPLLFAVRHGRPNAMAVVSALLKSGATTSQAQTQTGRTALHLAVIGGHTELVRRLAEAGADASVADNDGLTPLDIATRYCRPTIAALLTSHGAKATTAATPSLDLRARVAPGEAVVWYLGHSGWAVKTASRLLVFDYWQRQAPSEDTALCNGGIRPEEIAGQKVVVFASHEHADHFDPVIFTWRDKVPRIAYVLGTESKDAPPHTFVQGRQTVDVGGMKVVTFPASDAGVGFLVEVDGVRILHAGDHASTTRDLSGPFMPEITYLASLGPAPDIAFLPVSGCRFGDRVAVHMGVARALETLAPGVFFPMHAGGGEQVYRELIAKISSGLPKTHMAAAALPGDHFLVRKGRVVSAFSPVASPVTAAGITCALPQAPEGCAAR